jgi:hypothetical protein
VKIVQILKKKFRFWKFRFRMKSSDLKNCSDLGKKVQIKKCSRNKDLEKKAKD